MSASRLRSVTEGNVSQPTSGVVSKSREAMGDSKTVTFAAKIACRFVGTYMDGIECFPKGLGSNINQLNR